MSNGSLSFLSRDDSASVWSGSGSLSVPDGDVGSVLDRRGGGIKGGDAGGDDSANIVWGVALVAAPILIVMLLLRFRAAVETRQRASKPSGSASKRREGRQERYRTVDEREGSCHGIGSPSPEAVFVHIHGDWQQWAQSKRASARDVGHEGEARRSSWRGTFVRPPRSSSLEDFRHDTHQPGNPDLIWRNTTYSF